MRNFTRTWGESRRLLSAFGRTPHFRKIMRASTACLVLIVTAGIHFLRAETAHSQTIEDTYVEVKFSSGSLKNIFSAIEEQTNFMFVFPPDLIEEYANIDLKEGTVSVKNLLDSVLDYNELAYRQSGNNIIVSAKLKSGKINSLSDRLEMMQVKGKVVDREGAPMAGVNVVVRGTTNGTATDADGAYSIEASSNDWLVFSFIGYKKMEVLVGERTVIDLALEEDAQALQEVVVGTSYYTMSDDRKTASIVKITQKEIGNQPVVSPLLALQGRVAGLQINPNSGTPGDAPKIRIRGENSLRPYSGGPLYIIDGVIIDSNPVQSVSNLYVLSRGMDPLSGLNPENIESIEVLKDADATAIYGSRGANGVILVTTKQGKKTGGVNMDATFYLGRAKMPNYLDLQNTSQYLEMRREAFKNDNLTPDLFTFDLTAWDSTRYTDWQKELLGGTANISDAQINFSGGTATSSFRFGGSYHNEGTLISNDLGFKRYSGNFAFNHRSENGKFTATFNANYGVSLNKSFDMLTFVSTAITLPPNAPKLYTDNGELNWEPIKFDGVSLSTFTNPLADLLKSNESKMAVLVANATLSYQVLPGLFAKGNFGYTDGNGDELVKNPIAALDPSLIQPGSTASARFGMQKRTSWIIEPQLTYRKNRGNHTIDALIGSTFQEANSQYRAIAASGYKSDVLLNSLRGTDSYSFQADDYAQYRYCAFFARIGYDLKNRYLVNLTGRRDGSSRFGPGNRFGNFGAVGVAWIISDESFMENISNTISFAKLRGSYGVTGSDQIGDYQFYNLYTIGGARYQDGTALLPKGLFNKNFSWELTNKLEATLELGLLEDRRISFVFTWYRNRSSNQLVNYQLPVTTGFRSILTNFDATIENSGWEFGVQTQNFRSSDFEWSTSFNLTIPKNKLISFPNIEKTSYATIYQVGKSLSVQRLYASEGVDPQTGLYKIVDTNNNAYIDDGDRYFSDLFATKIYGGLMNSVRYRSFEFAFLFQFSNQKSFAPYSNAPGLGISNQPVGVMDRWQNEGDNARFGKFTTDYSVDLPFQQAIQSEQNIEDASFVKLKTITLTYNVPTSILGKLRMQGGQLFLQGQNLITWTDFTGLDPETGGGILPQLRTFSGGLKVKL